MLGHSQVVFRTILVNRTNFLETEKGSKDENRSCGFGLLGHLGEMCKNSNVSAVIEFNAVPFLEGVFELAQNGVIPGGTKKNLLFVQDDIDFTEVLVEYQMMMLADAQTSGGY